MKSFTPEFLENPEFERELVLLIEKYNMPKWPDVPSSIIAAHMVVCTSALYEATRRRDLAFGYDPATRHSRSKY